MCSETGGGVAVALVRSNVPGFVVEGHLYRGRDRDFFVFMGEQRQAWAACETGRDGSGYGRTVVSYAASREQAIAKLAEFLERSTDLRATPGVREGLPSGD